MKNVVIFFKCPKMSPHISPDVTLISPPATPPHNIIFDILEVPAFQRYSTWWPWIFRVMLWLRFPNVFQTIFKIIPLSCKNIFWKEMSYCTNFRILPVQTKWQIWGMHPPSHPPILTLLTTEVGKCESWMSVISNDWAIQNLFKRLKGVCSRRFQISVTAASQSAMFILFLLPILISFAAEQSEEYTSSDEYELNLDLT